ncbi:zinc knuckle protein [Gregarina niphandrodes]|uniref:Zinc knuckle protein n=1 Tax=Gregarina niphandrodes TaxID=110365 RepID=A0A023AW87_GRENI|nr:zinc knuckle protein [Gregarina niphandrodes]EZG42996.1 zinc knuckle protein [Gregarina niphandrodes]|eukprot:XP_011133731.1 zinc knuckle protein [Gregarina niphandrodes]
MSMHEPSLIHILVAQLPPELMDTVATLSDQARLDAEAFVSEMVRELFPFSGYLAEHLSAMLDFEQADLPHLPHRIKARLNRFVRLAARWERASYIPTWLLRDRALAANSEAYRCRFRDVARDRPLLRVVTELHGSSGRVGAPVFAAAEDLRVAQDEPEEGEAPPGPCCGVCDGAHYAKACPFREHACFNCGQKGHLRRKCRVQFLPDVYGHPAHRVETARNGWFHVRVGGDRTKGDRLDTAKRVVDMEHVAWKQARERQAAQRQGGKGVGLATLEPAAPPGGTADTRLDRLEEQLGQLVAALAANNPPERGVGYGSPDDAANPHFG